MTAITIRIVDEQLKRRLWLRAAEHGRTIEDEARDILRSALTVSAPPRDPGQAVRTRVQSTAGIELGGPAESGL